MSRLARMFVYLILVLAVLACLVTGLYKRFSKPSIEQFDVVDRLPVIYPDYSRTVIPANIAPLNFLIKEKGDYYFVRIHSQKGEAIEIFSRRPKVVIPQKAWRNLLKDNGERELYFDIFVRNGKNQWSCFAPVTNKIADEDIDDFVVYRKIHPTHVLYYGDIGIYQRNLRNFDEKVILDKSYLGEGSCLNCHTFCRNNPSKMLTGVRSPVYGVSTIVIQDENINKIGAKFGYSCWHPSGKLAVYSVDNLPMFFHSARVEIRDTVDIDSYLAYYLVDSKVVKVPPELSRKQRLETWPMWSADGMYLYFCSAPMLWLQKDKIPPDEYKDVRYDLVRISYDIAADRWGQEETIVSGIDNGQSIAMPKTSPDGRWLSFCMFDYGFFPTWQKSSDLFLIDLEAGKKTGQYVPKRLQMNSDKSESWHCWSSNSRWIVFSSKRDYGVFTRLYISYIDEEGNAYKPFVIPQKDPTFYDSCLQAFNTPELTVEPLSFSGEGMARIARGSEIISPDMPVTMATPKAEGASGSDWHGQRE